MSFQDHFSPRAQEYSRFRPGYPRELFQYLADRAPARRRVWDCATGSGQAAVALAEHFEAVVATDASARQISHATPHPRVRYAKASAEASGIEPASVDLITVAQALHWFDFDAFYREVRRVARPRALFAAWGYGLLRTENPKINHAVASFYSETIAAYWPPERKHLDSGYDSIPCPFITVVPPLHSMTAHWTLRQLIGYIDTWSAVARYRRAQEQDPLPALADRIGKLWGKAEGSVEIRWPLYFKLGRVPVQKNADR